MFGEDLACKKLHVTGNEQNITGTYIVSDEFDYMPFDKPVYKLAGKDMYIYFHQTDAGWVIGSRSHLFGETKGFLYTSKFSF